MKKCMHVYNVSAPGSLELWNLGNGDSFYNPHAVVFNRYEGCLLICINRSADRGAPKRVEKVKQ